ncbi:MAG: hypothetical protein ABSG84_17605 [Acidobacteriaceae bacterium]|jgi:uncharacterized membrane protein YeaQ/YmgE (transglycosylase-associated protein family)
MDNEHAERRTPLWATALVVFIGAFTCQCILNWDAILVQGFKAIQWDSILASAFGAIVLIWVMPAGQREEITTLGIGKLKARKLQ